MDFFDLSLDQDELLQRAKHEAEDLAQFKDVDNLDAGEIEILRALQKKMKKQTSRTPRLVISSNKGNFSNFRNKTFIPNASRVAAVVTKTGKSVSVESGVTVARSGDSTHLQKQVATSVVEEGDEDDDEDNDEDDDKAVPSETKIITSTSDEESDDEPVAKSVVKSRPLPPQRNTNKESMFNAFGSGSDSDEDED